MKWIIAIIIAVLFSTSCSSNSDEKYEDINRRMYGYNNVMGRGISRFIDDFPGYAMKHIPLKADSLTTWVYGFHKFQSENYGGVGDGRLHQGINENDSIFKHDLYNNKDHKYYEFTRDHIELAKKAADLYYDTTKSFFEYRELAKPLIKEIEKYKTEYIIIFEDNK